jgi:hypothetical protein
MTQEAETTSEGEGSEVRPLPAPPPGQAVQEEVEPRPLPKPLAGQMIQKADDSEPLME